MVRLSLLLALLLPLTAPAAAQGDNAWWNDGCDAQARAILDPVFA